MSITKWLKYQWIEPQLNKAIKKANGHRGMAEMLNHELADKGSQSRRDRMNMEYNYHMADIWQLKRERLQSQMDKLMS